MIHRVRVPSETEASKLYVVTTVLGEAVACTCPHYNYRADTATFECKHMRQVRVGIEALRLLVRG